MRPMFPSKQDANSERAPFREGARGIVEFQMLPARARSSEASKHDDKRSLLLEPLILLMHQKKSFKFVDSLNLTNFKLLGHAKAAVSICSSRRSYNTTRTQGSNTHLFEFRCHSQRTTFERMIIPEINSQISSKSQLDSSDREGRISRRSNQKKSGAWLSIVIYGLRDLCRPDASHTLSRYRELSS